MGVDKNKITAEATKYIQKSQWDKAIKAYERILAEDPKDVRVLLKIGELQQKKGDNPSAAETFNKVAEAYSEQGFFLKAVAVYKQILKLSPTDPGVPLKLAGLYQQLGLMSDAMGQLQLVAQAHEKANENDKLVQVLKQMVELDPENVASRIKLGDVYGKQNKTKESRAEFQAAAEVLKKGNRADEYIKVAERLSALDPDDMGLARELANTYLSKGDTKRALAKLQLCFKANPRDLDTLGLLAQAFRDLGQISKAVSVYKEQAAVLQEQRKTSELQDIYRKILEIAPDDADARAALGGGKPPPAATATVTKSYPPPAVTKPPPAAPPPAKAATAPPPPARASTAPAAESISKLLTETDVYMKYGLHDKALEHLKKVLATDPQSPEAHERARDLFKAKGDAKSAGESAVAAVRASLAKNLTDRAQAAMAKLREIAPKHPQLAALAAQLQSGGTTEPDVLEVGSDADEGGVLLESAEIVMDPDGGVAEVEVLEPDMEVEPLIEDDAGVGADDAALAAAMAAAEADADIVPEEDEPIATVPSPVSVEELAEPTDPEQTLFDDPNTDPEGDLVDESPTTRPSRVKTPAVPPPRAAPPPAKPAPIKAASAPAKAAPPKTAPAKAAPPPARAAPPAKAAPPPAAKKVTSTHADLSEEIDEADFFKRNGLIDEAREALEHLLAKHPGHPDVLAKMAELDAGGGAEEAAVEEDAAPVPAPSPFGEGGVGDPGDDDSFDIARELAEELGAEAEVAPAEDDLQFSVEDVFSQFKKGVEKTVRPEDSETHYDLGIAYKEMGLVDDALHEFEVALSGKNRKKEIDCLTMIGLCHMIKEQPKDAIGAFRKGLQSDYATPEVAKALHYEIGAAYRDMGSREEALFFFQKAFKADAGYRDAKAQIDTLGGGPGRAPKDAAQPPAPAAGKAAPANGAGKAGAPAPRGTPPDKPPAGPPKGGAKKNIGYV
jgi:tetratricopeptide (TPR) repeat protein